MSFCRPGNRRSDWKAQCKIVNKESQCEIWTYWGRPSAIETILEDSLLEGTHQDIVCRILYLVTSIEEWRRPWKAKVCRSGLQTRYETSPSWIQMVVQKLQTNLESSRQIEDDSCRIYSIRHRPVVIFMVMTAEIEETHSGKERCSKKSSSSASH